MKWQDLESHVRLVASSLYDAPANAETINGVKCDCVLRERPDRWIIIEISKEKTLDKLRTDLAKFASVRPFLFSKNIYCECIFVCEDEPPPSLVETGRGDHVEVLSASQFSSKVLDYDNYRHIRSSKTFGSAIDPFSGKKDDRKYIPVTYEGVTVPGKTYTLADIAGHLQHKERVVLLGNYGTGKSRCVQELFGAMASADMRKEFVLSMDLRDNWGVRRAHELIRRHFDDLGLSQVVDNVLKVLTSGSLIFLIDGFDEIGSQTWSDDPTVLRTNRRRSLAAVKDLAAKSPGGILVTGREHYFNSDAEMYDCLGLPSQSSIVIRCREGFTNDEMVSYFRELSGQDQTSIPRWLPKRPLVCHVLSALEPDTRQGIMSSESGEMQLWHSLLNAICDREAKINSVLDASVVRGVLVRLARLTRTKGGNVGPLSVAEINQCFQDVVNLPPVDESAVMLQRLPMLGRVGTETTDRQFVDEYFLDGLRAEDVNQSVYSQDTSCFDEPWSNPLCAFGLRVIRAEMEASPNSSGFVRFLRQAANQRNAVLAGEIASSLLDAHGGDFDFAGLLINGTHITRLDLSDSTARNLTIDQSVIEQLDISNARVENVIIRNSLISSVEGVSDAKGLPPWVQHNNEIEHYRRISTVSRIRNAPLSLHQRIFVTVIKKTFFQPGAGRKEEALTRGLGQSVERKAVNRILNALVEEGILKKAKGKDGHIYAPNRKYTKRMDDILTQLTLSEDPLWTALRTD